MKEYKITQVEGGYIVEIIKVDMLYQKKKIYTKLSDLVQDVEVFFAPNNLGEVLDDRTRLRNGDTVRIGTPVEVGVGQADTYVSRMQYDPQTGGLTVV